MKRRHVGWAGCLVLGLTAVPAGRGGEDPPIRTIDLDGQVHRQVVVDREAGQYLVRLKDNTKGYDTAYPGVELLPDGTFVTTTYGHWVLGEEPYVLSVRFRLEELDAIAARK